MKVAWTAASNVNPASNFARHAVSAFWKDHLYSPGAICPAIAYCMQSRYQASKVTPHELSARAPIHRVDDQVPSAMPSESTTQPFDSLAERPRSRNPTTVTYSLLLMRSSRLPDQTLVFVILHLCSFSPSLDTGWAYSVDS